MEVTQEQVEEIGEAIRLGDVLAYIDEHKDEYEEYLRNEEIENKAEFNKEATLI